MTERFHTFIGMVDYGGPGSGNFGHKGRPGKVGGSSSGSGGKHLRGKKNAPSAVADAKATTAKAIREGVPKAHRDLTVKLRCKVSYDGFEDKDQGALLNQLKTIDSAVDEIKKVFPSIDPQLKMVQIENSVTLSKVKASGSYGMFQPRTKSIHLATGYISTKKPELDVGKESFAVGTDLASTFRHEYGHAVMDSYRLNTHAWYSIKKPGASNISAYAGMSKSECFAEAFSAYTSPKYKKGMLPKATEQFFDQMKSNSKRNMLL
jgi:hypothetical protein